MTCGGLRQPSSTRQAIRWNRSARCSRTPGKGVTAIYARWDKFALRREMAMVVERALRETLDNKPGRPEPLRETSRRIAKHNWPTPLPHPASD